MSIKIFYLPLRARTECICLMLHYTNTSYQLEHIPFKQWSSIKKGGGSDISPLEQLPSIQLPSGEIIVQSGAIARYVARLCNLYPTDSIDIAKADMIYETSQEMNTISPILNYYPMKSEQYNKNHASYFKTFPKYAKVLENWLQNGPYFGGKQPYYSDFGLLHIIDSSITVEPTCVSTFPVLNEWYKIMMNDPKVKDYMINIRKPSKEVGFPGTFIQSLE